MGGCTDLFIQIFSISEICFHHTVKPLLCSTFPRKEVDAEETSFSFDTLLVAQRMGVFLHGILPKLPRGLAKAIAILLLVEFCR